jgi:small-conductance mechanosensitive channel
MMARYLLSLITLLVFQTSSYSQDSVATAQVHRTIETLRANKEIFPVVINNDTVFNVYEKAAAKSKTAQVRRCEDRLKEILSHDFYHKDDLAVSDSANYIVVTYEGNTVIEFSDITAKKLNRGKAIIADKYVEKLGEYFDRIQPLVLKEKAVKVVEYLAVYLFFLFVIIFIYKYNKRWILRNHHFIHKVLRLIRIYKLEEEERENATTNFLKIIKWLYGFGIAIYTYLTLPFILNIFYLTRERGERMIAYVVNPFFDFVNTFVDYLPTLIKLIVIIFIFRSFLKLVNYFFKELEAGNVSINGFYKEWATPTSKLVKLFLYAFLLTIIFPLLPGSGSDVFKGVSMFLGLILSLGSTSVISNALSGLIMTYMRPFKIGDRIEADNVIGIVVQRNLLMTRVRTPKNVIITIPNAKILTGHSKNFTTAAERSNLIIHSSITIGYDVDWRIVHKLLIAAAKKTNGLIEQSGKEAFVLQNSLDDNYVEYEINAYTAQADKYVFIKSELHSNIIDEFNNSSIEILSPKYVSSRSGENRTFHDVPADVPEVKEVVKKKKEMDINEKITLKMEQIEKEKEGEKTKEKDKKEETEDEKKDTTQDKNKEGDKSKDSKADNNHKKR